MFHAIVVDDENAALNRFERIALKDSRIIIDGKFLYEEDAIAFIKEHLVDIAFLDVEMPEMNGLELAERLMEIDPYIRIVFVTAYNQYALDAFRAHAIGYLLKPLDSEEFTEQVDLLSRRYRQRPEKGSKNLLYVKCFGRFSVYTEDENASVIRWKTTKAEELFALLIHYQGKVKPKEYLIDILWPELEPERSANLFRVTCTYLRSALAEKGFSDILVREFDGYKINIKLIDCDLFRFMPEVRSISSLETTRLNELSNLYSGEYLEGKPYDWAVGRRIQLEGSFKKIQHCLSDVYCTHGFMDKALDVLEKVLMYDPCDEETVMRIVNIKLQKGDHSSAIKTYREFEKILMEELGIAPSEQFPAEVTDQKKRG
ncbi:MAG: response regulator [Lachnospiraceae bacterium]|nr:response regulator [Lachnospiraceae bacterium]